MKRDLHADLAICNAAAGGPWEIVANNFVVDAIGAKVCEMLADEDNDRLIVEARTGWPHAIERALAAEAEVERLRNIFGNHAAHRALKYYTDEVDCGSTDDWESVFSARVESAKLSKEASE